MYSKDGNRKKVLMINWIHNGKEITEVPSKAVGFIYRFDFDDGTFYFGQKTLSLSKKRIVAESTAKKNGKSLYRKYKSKTGKNKGQWIYYIDEYDSDSWVDYKSSSDLVKQKIEDGEKYRKEILMFVTHKGQLNWEETKIIICSGCMEDENCLNLRTGNYHKRNIIKYKNG